MPVPRKKLWYSYTAANDPEIQLHHPFRLGFRKDNRIIVEYTCKEDAETIPSNYLWPDKQLVIVAPESLVKERFVEIRRFDFEQL